jgi:hypothetical protein
MDVVIPIWVGLRVIPLRNGGLKWRLTGNNAEEVEKVKKRN